MPGGPDGCAGVRGRPRAGRAAHRRARPPGGETGRGGGAVRGGRDGASGGGPGPAAAGSEPGQARPAVFWVRRETESMTTAASRTTPVIMDWTASLELPDM